VIQVIANGLVNGAILALIAISLTIIFGIFRVPHFGLGGIFVWGAFAAFFAERAGAPFAVSIVIAGLATAGLGWVIDRLVFRPLRGATEDAMFVAAIGVLGALDNAALLLFGSDTRSIPIPDSLSTVVSVQGVVYLPLMRVMILVLAAVTFVLLYLFVKLTPIGKAMRAVAQDAAAARLLGIPIERVAGYTFALGSAMAGMAGAIVGAALTFNFETGSLAILKAFVVVVLGGLGSVPGAILGGVVLGIVESVTVTYVTSQFKQLVAFGLLILVLVIRPAGLLGQRSLRADATAGRA
jgi:branched-chain amino acid transport system permease protein